ncbi:MAG: hypothetical protein WKF68_11560 [Daejeonella sp.]
MKKSNQSATAGDIPKDKKALPEEDIDDMDDPKEQNRGIVDDDDDDFDITLDDDIKGFDEFDDEDDEDDDGDDDF